MALRLVDLVKQYLAPDGGVVPVVDIAEFELADGEHLALAGSSGSGKSTLLNLIAGILTPDRGRVIHRVPGESEIDIASLAEARRDAFRGRHLGIIFQTHHLLPGFTALENVLLGMSFTGRAPDRGWAKHLLEEVGLGDRMAYRPSRLSVGQQQRVAVARALANRPSLVLADEPTGSLDPSTSTQVVSLIRSLCGEAGAALLLVSHDPQVAAAMPRVVRFDQLNRTGVGAS